jgi:hypothetical protein
MFCYWKSSISWYSFYMKYTHVELVLKGAVTRGSCWDDGILLALTFSPMTRRRAIHFCGSFTCQLQDLSARSELATPVHFFWHRQTRVGSWSNTCLSVVIAVVAGPLIILRGRSKNVFSTRFSRKELWYLLWDSLSKYRTFLREPTRRACHEHDGGLLSRSHRGATVSRILERA